MCWDWRSRIWTTFGRLLDSRSRSDVAVMMAPSGLRSS